MENCQNDGVSFLDNCPRGRVILRDQKRDHNPDNLPCVKLLF